MDTFQFKSEHFLYADINAVWDFFSAPNNLSLLTPPEMEFTILSLIKTKEVYEGMVIDYTVKPFLGLVFHWQTIISDIEKYKRFTDIQTKGPFKIWKHTHKFTEKEGGVLIENELNYMPAYGILGKIAHALFLRKRIEYLFKFRNTTVENIFNKNANTPH